MVNGGTGADNPSDARLNLELGNTAVTNIGNSLVANGDVLDLAGNAAAGGIIVSAVSSLTTATNLQTISPGIGITNWSGSSGINLSKTGNSYVIGVDTNRAIPTNAAIAEWNDVYTNAARTSDLGTAAFANVVVSTSDRTAGRLLTVGWMGMAANAYPNLADLDDQNTVNGMYAVSSTNTANVSSLPPGAPQFGTIEIKRFSSSQITQTYVPSGSFGASSDQIWIRSWSPPLSAWFPWKRVIKDNDLVSSTTDVTWNKIPTVGWMGYGRPIALGASDNILGLEAFTNQSNARYEWGAGGVPANIPFADAGFADRFYNGPTYEKVIIYRRGSNDSFVNTKVANNWSGWSKNLDERSVVTNSQDLTADRLVNAGWDFYGAVGRTLAIDSRANGSVDVDTLAVGSKHLVRNVINGACPTVPNGNQDWCVETILIHGAVRIQFAYGWGNSITGEDRVHFRSTGATSFAEVPWSPLSIGSDATISPVTSMVPTYNAQNKITNVQEIVQGKTKTTVISYRADGKVSSITITHNGTRRVESYNYTPTGLVSSVSATNTRI